MTKKIGLIVCLILLLNFNWVWAMPIIEISSEKDSYTIGDEVTLFLDIFNPSESEETYFLTESIYCVGESSPFPTIFSVSVPGRSTMSLINTPLRVTETTPPCTFVYELGLIESGVSVALESFEIEVIGTLRTFDYFDVRSCKDEICSKISRVFELLDSRIYLKSFKTEGVDLIGTLTLPDTSTQTLTFTNNIAEIPITQTGTYSAEITASKEGYQDYTSYIEFKVVDEISEVIDLTHICNPPDGDCRQDETYQNCPQDCDQKPSNILTTIHNWINDIETLPNLFNIIGGY